MPCFCTCACCRGEAKNALGRQLLRELGQCLDTLRQARCGRPFIIRLHAVLHCRLALSHVLRDIGTCGRLPTLRIALCMLPLTMHVSQRFMHDNVTALLLVYTATLSPQERSTRVLIIRSLVPGAFCVGADLKVRLCPFPIVFKVA